MVAQDASGNSLLLIDDLNSTRREREREREKEKERGREEGEGERKGERVRTCCRRYFEVSLYPRF